MHDRKFYPPSRNLINSSLLFLRIRMHKVGIPLKRSLSSTFKSICQYFKHFSLIGYTLKDNCTFPADFPSAPTQMGMSTAQFPKSDFQMYIVNFRCTYLAFVSRNLIMRRNLKKYNKVLYKPTSNRWNKNDL